MTEGPSATSLPHLISYLSFIILQAQQLPPRSLNGYQDILSRLIACALFIHHRSFICEGFLPRTEFIILTQHNILMLHTDIRPWESEDHLVTDRLPPRNNVKPRRTKMLSKSKTPRTQLPTFYYQFFSKIAQKRLGFVPTKHHSASKQPAVKLPKIVREAEVIQEPQVHNSARSSEKKQLRKKHKSQNWRKLARIEVSELGVFDCGDSRLDPYFVANYRT